MVRTNELIRVSVLPLVIGLLGQWRAIDLLEISKSFRNSNTIEELCYEYPAASNKHLSDTDAENYHLFLENDFIGFKEALAFKESQGRYGVINRFGYLGKYQFGKGTLALVGVRDTNLFLNSPELQEKAFKANVSRNKWVLRRDIKRFVGKVVGGVLVTESGIVAAAHLGGPGSVKKFLRSGGKVAFRDRFGTSIVEYMDKFKSYDLSDIPVNKKAKVDLVGRI
ncbi:hypothetical protein [Aquimarina agarivorans]|uniref:hypothetical protein n=1 Tax=Aquimarina agarivorans TaxID=980584 RepID=UPI000248E5CA|nr:hypothetical protein [Aquimarina agarivorans]